MKKNKITIANLDDFNNFKSLYDKNSHDDKECNNKMYNIVDLDKKTTKTVETKQKPKVSVETEEMGDKSEDKEVKEAKPKAKAKPRASRAKSEANKTAAVSEVVDITPVQINIKHNKSVEKISLHDKNIPEPVSMLDSDLKRKRNIFDQLLTHS